MIWFSADFHINHKNILKYCNRPFATVQEHDEHIIAQINKHVNSDDTLYFLGDLLFSNEKYYQKNLVDLLAKINCKNIRWCRGNHDPAGFLLNQYRHSTENINDIFEYKELNLNNKFFVMCHYAMAIWNKSHRGAYHVYGHSHSTAEDNLDRLFPGRRSMDVGIDNAYKLLGEYRPFSIDEVVTILDKKSNDNKPGAIDHHGAT